MRKILSVLMAVFLIISFIPTSASAASKTYYYVVGGTSKVAPGIYKGTVNGKGTAVVKEKVYKKKKLSKSPVSSLKLDKTYSFYGKGSVAKKTDEKYSLIQYPIQHVEADGKNLYYAKFSFQIMSFCGDSSDVLDIYKRGSNGKSTKLVSDKITSRTTQAFAIKNKYIYYPKLNKNPFGNFDIVRATLDGKKKATLKKSVDDFWVRGKYIYYVKNDSLYRMDLNGKNAKIYENLKGKVYADTECNWGNYYVSENGIVFNEMDNKTIFFDFSTENTVSLPNVSVSIYDVDINKKRLVALNFNDKTYSAGVYNFSGKQMKKLKSFNYNNTDIYSIDAKKGEFLYIDGTNLKKINF